MYYLMDLERTIESSVAHYWKPNRHGYVTDIQEAGKFDLLVAQNLVESDFDKRTVMIPVEVVEKILKVKPTLDELIENITDDNKHDEKIKDTQGKEVF